MSERRFFAACFMGAAIFVLAFVAVFVYWPQRDGGVYLPEIRNGRACVVEKNFWGDEVSVAC